MTQKIAIHWFRQDLRLLDNPALKQAAQHACVLPIYILDDCHPGEHVMGGASFWWLHHSLKQLDISLGNRLSVYRGNPQDVLHDLIARFDIEAIYWNRGYESWCINRDRKIEAYVKNQGIEVHTFMGSLLWEPWEIKKKDGTPYKVFSSFYSKGCLHAKTPRVPLEKPEKANYIVDQAQIGIDMLDLLPRIHWDTQFSSLWRTGEEEAHQRLKLFIERGLSGYKAGRNFPAKLHASRLSPYLHFGEISPNQIWHAMQGVSGNEEDIACFCSELGWREFFYSQLYYNPELPHRNLQAKFDRFPWVENANYLAAWQRGETGVPMVDAGMRELWQTGYMHNRLRMIVGSFLVKNLRLYWHHGERWFWDTLVDADLASNSANWQWIAGCGADAVPYFRIFNPVIQGKKFDPDGVYVRKYIPEIARLPDKYLFSPWEAPKPVLQEAGIVLGVTYSEPIVDLKESREAALQAFQLVKLK